jgi:hypothetical protein
MQGYVLVIAHGLSNHQNADPHHRDVKGQSGGAGSPAGCNLMVLMQLSSSARMRSASTLFHHCCLRFCKTDLLQRGVAGAVI